MRTSAHAMVLQQRLQGRAPQPRRDAHHEPAHPRCHSPNTPLPHVHDPLRPLQTSTTPANTPSRTHGIPTAAGPQRLRELLRHPDRHSTPSTCAAYFLLQDRHTRTQRHVRNAPCQMPTRMRQRHPRVSRRLESRYPSCDRRV
ncbi:hypothetical protein B0H10DRAFT_2035863, partial [Mycena sp. CBHHK59/15]